MSHSFSDLFETEELDPAKVRVRDVSERVSAGAGVIYTSQ